MISKKYVVIPEFSGGHSLRVNGEHLGQFSSTLDARKSIERRITATLRNWKRYGYTAITRDGDTISAEPPHRPVQVLVRMPQTLHERLQIDAERRGVSVNKVIVERLA